MSNDSGLSNHGSPSESKLRYHRLRSATRSGDSVQIPPLNQTVANWSEKASEPTSDVDIHGVDLETLKQLGRAEVIQLATSYTHQYRDVDLTGRDSRSVVMSGHQPLLFHPGVWFKNFALSSVSAAVAATPINLVVDNDVCGPASIKCPSFNNGRAFTQLVDIDGAHPAVPYETRPIADEKLFESFADRAAEQVGRCFAEFDKQSSRLVTQLWSHVQAARKSFDRSPSLGATLAAGRHRLEQDAGLKTLEIPISAVAQTHAFAQFAAAIITDQTKFNECYNGRLTEYRDVHGIRSNAHPVPGLDRDDGWLESPFWVWSSDQPQRKRLFVKCTKTSVTLTDREGWRLETEWINLPSALLELREQQVAVRPRALITTLFCRLVLSDLFLHGIGGAKYDQLTDLIASDFFGVTLPPFSTLTATMHLPFEYPIATPADRARIGQGLRERKFHPERFVDSKTANDWIGRKRAAIENTTMNRLQRHHEIEEANRMLQPFVADQTEAMRQKLLDMDEQIHNSRILNSREYSFCLFNESLIDNLKRMAGS